jgi:hypothetical protein
MLSGQREKSTGRLRGGDKIWQGIKYIFMTTTEKGISTHTILKIAKEAKSWERAYNKHTKADDHVHVDTTREIPRKRRTHSARRRSNSYSMGLFGRKF